MMLETGSWILLNINAIKAVHTIFMGISDILENPELEPQFQALVRQILSNQNTQINTSQFENTNFV